MTKQRLRVILEFNDKKELENDMWQKLSKFSNPAAYVKDVLGGLLPPLYPIDYNVHLGAIENIKFEEIQ